MFVSEDVQLNSFRSTERKRKVFEELFTERNFKHQKARSPFLLVRKLAPFIRIREAMWL
jgi:hypothetical protein